VNFSTLVQGKFKAKKKVPVLFQRTALVAAGLPSTPSGRKTPRALRVNFSTSFQGKFKAKKKRLPFFKETSLGVEDRSPFDSLGEKNPTGAQGELLDLVSRKVQSKKKEASFFQGNLFGGGRPVSLRLPRGEKPLGRSG
jgi:hypothetical protein